MTTRLLVVDPDISFMVGLKQALESTGEFRVSLAANVSAAEDALRHTAYEVAVVAFGIENLDVMELIRTLRGVQPDLRLITCPATDAHLERARFLDVQAVVPKPFTASQLLPHLRRIVQAGIQTAPQDDFSPPQMPPALRDLVEGAHEQPVEKPRTPTGLLARFGLRREDVEAAPEAPESAEPERRRPLPQTAELRWPGARSDSGQRQPEPSAAPDVAREWPDPPQTTVLRSATLADEPSADDGTSSEWPEWEAASPDAEGAWPLPDSPYDSDADRAVEDAPFDDVLDAFADLPPGAPRSPRDQAFDELVDSMRGTPPRRTRLEDLLASIAADAVTDDEAPEAESTLDFVLNAMRRGDAAAPSGETDDDELDDATIGEVIDGLFEPSFEGVLAALAGEDVPDEESGEAAYPAEDARDEPAPQADDLTWGELGAASEMPAWLEEYDLTVESAVDESWPRPVEGDDSSYYPATTALTAVSSAEDDEFSLNQLLNQLESQLQPAPLHRPRLKPLPSWEREGDAGTADRLAALFDRAEAGDLDEFDSDFQPEPEPFVAAQPDLLDEPLASTHDTRQAGAATRQTDDEAFLDELLGQPAWASDEDTRVAARAPDESDEWADDDVERAFYDGVRLSEEGGTPWGEDEVWQTVPPPPEPAYEAAAEPESVDEFPRPDEAAFEPHAGVAWDVGDAVEAGMGEEPDIPGAAAYDLPADEAAEIGVSWPEDAPGAPTAPDEQAWPGEPADVAPSDEDDEVDLAQIAVMLTQYSLESSAQATLLTRPGTLVAEAGELPEAAMDHLFDLVDAAWRLSTPEATSLIRFITLPEAGDFLLYSTRVERDLTLSMAFHANTPVRTIRRQAHRLSESLELVQEAAELPDIDARALSPQADVPAMPRPVDGPHAAPAVEAPPEASDAAAQEDDGPHAAYTCVWLPYDPAMELEAPLADDLRAWIEDAAEAAAWDVLEVAVRADYVQVALSVPQKIAPDDAIGHLMQLTAERSAARYAQLASGPPLWMDGYYVVSPPRDLTEREISRFITYQRQSTLQE